MTDMSWMPWVVGGVMVLSFLYMKVWPFVRTIIRAFRGSNTNRLLRAR